MIRILLVEDEIPALQALEKKINDLGQNYLVVGRANNGRQALELIADAKPQVVLTDIRMPEMDGIMLVEQLNQYYPHIIPIIASGYQEFDYAKQAVRLGVRDYLLKPVNPSELLACLQSCELQLKKRKNGENMFSFLVGDDSCIIEDKSGLQIFLVAYFIIANALSKPENIVHPNISYFSSNLLEEIASEELPRSMTTSCFDGIFSNEKVLVITLTPASQRVAISALKVISERLERNIGSFITVFWSNVEQPSTLRSTIQTCRRGATQGMILGHTQILDKFASKVVPDVQLRSRADLFAMLMRQNEIELLRSNVKKMFLEWSKMNRTVLSTEVDLVYLISSMHQAILPQSQSLNISYYVENLACFSRNEQEFAENYFQLLLELFHHKKDTTSKSLSPDELVTQVEAYLQQNLCEALTLQTLSDQIGISKVYLCRIFKRCRDTTPMDHFTHMKIDEASKLLKDFPQLPIREISDRLGFNDSYYFSKVFKRITGVSPSDARA